MKRIIELIIVLMLSVINVHADNVNEYNYTLNTFDKKYNTYLLEYNYDATECAKYSCTRLNTSNCTSHGCKPVIYDDEGDDVCSCEAYPQPSDPTVPSTSPTTEPTDPCAQYTCTRLNTKNCTSHAGCNYSIVGVDDECECHSVETSQKTSTKAASPTETGNLSEMLDLCESSGFLQLIYIIRSIFPFICYAIALMLIIMLTLDISKVVTDPQSVKKVLEVSKKRILIGLLAIFAPILIHLLLTTIGGESDLNRCYSNANPKHIADRKEKEKEELSKMTTTVAGWERSTRQGTTQPVAVGAPLNLSKSDYWVDNNEEKDWMFGYYLYVPKDAYENMPLVVMLPGDNGTWNQNWRSQGLKTFFSNNYGSGKKYKYSKAFILIPKIDYRDSQNNYVKEFMNRLDGMLRGDSTLVDNKTINGLKINKSRISLVGFSTGASAMFDYALHVKERSSTLGFTFSAMLPISSGAGANQNSYFKNMPMKGVGECSGTQRTANNVGCGDAFSSAEKFSCDETASGGQDYSAGFNAYGSMKNLFSALGKSNELVGVSNYCHGKMTDYVFSVDVNNDGYNDYLEWLISQGSGGTTTISPYAGTDGLFHPIGSQTTKKVDGVDYASEVTDSCLTLAYAIEDEVHSGGHKAIDIGVGMGTNLIAIGDGTVVTGNDQYKDHLKRISYEKLDCNNPKSETYVGYSNSITIKLDNGLIVVYGHIKQNSIPSYLKKTDGTVKTGTRVYKGEVIAQSGHNGCSSGAHLDFSINNGGPPLDPLDYIQKKNMRCCSSSDSDCTFYLSKH